MGKARAVLLLAGAAALAGGVFGTALAQLSYSVGADYFRDVLFPAWGIPDTMAPRLGAALVGLQAGARLALILGLPVFLLGAAILRRGTTLVPAGLGALAVGAILALGGAMLALAFGLSLPEMADRLTPSGTAADPGGYRRAALMQRGALWGAVIGVVPALWTLRQAQRMERPGGGAG